jgi:hypothetical protein
MNNKNYICIPYDISRKYDEQIFIVKDLSLQYGSCISRGRLIDDNKNIRLWTDLGKGRYIIFNGGGATALSGTELENVEYKTAVLLTNNDMIFISNDAYYENFFNKNSFRFIKESSVRTESGDVSGKLLEYSVYQ